MTSTLITTGTPICIKFKGNAMTYALELRGTPGPLIALGWLDQDRHDDYHEDYELNDWEAFHDATRDAFCDLGARTVWINAELIDWWREL